MGRQPATDTKATTPTSAELVEVLSAILRGEAVTWPASASPEDQAQFLDACTVHGVTPLVYHHLHQTFTWTDWPVTIRATLAHLSRVQTAVDLLHEQELVEVLQALADRGVQPLLMKGTPLAYTHYASPELRPRCDTDLLIRTQDIATTQRVLTELGYMRLNAVSGRLVMSQCTYVKQDWHGVRHACDVHWKISNVHLFADLLGIEELAERAVPVPALGDYARTLAPAYALVLACLHRVAHHSNSQRLIWVYDIHVLVSGMQRGEQAEFVRLATDKQLRAICGRGLRLAQQYLATPVPADVTGTLRVPDASATDEVSVRFLSSDQRRWQVLLADLQVLPGWRNKVCLLKEHVFPPAAYLLTRHATTNRSWLPALYVHRALRGLWRLGQRTGE